MSVLNSKDSDRLEVIRFYSETDPVFFSVLNRVGEDIEQRTKDLNRIFTPSRGLRVRQTSTPSASIEVEIGIYVDPDGITIQQSNSGAVQTIAIPAAGVGQKRVDLIYFNLATGLAVRVAGVEFPAANPFSFSLKPNLPSGLAGVVPLAVLFVDETPTDFDETITGNLAGQIVDVRPAVAAHRPLFSNAAALSDTSGGAAGTGTAVAREGHRHALNVDSVLPAPDSGAGLSGAATTYSKRDHVHPGNYSLVSPTALGLAVAAAAGTSLQYSRGDHSHDTSALALKTTLLTLTWAAESGAKSGAVGMANPEYALVLFAGHTTAQGSNVPAHSTGVAVFGGSNVSVASVDNVSASSNETSSADSDAVGGAPQAGLGFITNHAQGVGEELDVSQFTTSTFELTPTGSITGTAFVLIVGQ